MYSTTSYHHRYIHPRASPWNSALRVIREIGYGHPEEEEVEPPEANFRAQPMMGDAPHTVTFRNTSTGEYTEWLWDFGDGESSTSRSPSHTYQQGGTYQVCLTVTGSGGSDTHCLTAQIIVEDVAAAGKLIVRNLNITPAYAQPGQEVQVTARVVNEGGTWGSDTVNLMINGQFEQSRSVGVAPGTAQTISFTIYKVQAAEYQVNIEGATGTFYVTEEQKTPAPKAGGLLGGGKMDTNSIIAAIAIGIIIVSGTAVAFLLARPR
ncbi:PKD domain-containing protein [Chloroflexota bacterium]